MAQGFLLGMPRWRFWNVNGTAPLSLGKVYFTESGTATPQNTWSNSDLTSLNTNPVILSASGECTIFVPQGDIYDVDLFDANDVHQAGYPIEGMLAIPAPDPPAPTPSPVPVGGIVAYGGAAAPSGYLLCNGSLVNRTTFADLFTAIGILFGAGDGSTTFQLPDLRQRFPLGKAASGTGSTLGGTGGLIDHVHTGPSHTHTGTVDVSHTHNVTVAAHQHNVTAPSNGWVGASTAPSVATRILLGDGATTYNQPTVDNVVISAANGAINQNTGAATISTVNLTIAAGGTGDTGTANAPFQAVNFIIKT
jgi:microcystin-dependent protein